MEGAAKFILKCSLIQQIVHRQDLGKTKTIKKTNITVQVLFYNVINDISQSVKSNLDNKTAGAS